MDELDYNGLFQYLYELDSGEIFDSARVYGGDTGQRSLKA